MPATATALTAKHAYLLLRTGRKRIERERHARRQPPRVWQQRVTIYSYRHGLHLQAPPPTGTATATIYHLHVQSTAIMATREASDATVPAARGGPRTSEKGGRPIIAQRVQEVGGQSGRIEAPHHPPTRLLSDAHVGKLQPVACRRVVANQAVEVVLERLYQEPIPPPAADEWMQVVMPLRASPLAQSPRFPPLCPRKGSCELHTPNTHTRLALWRAL